MTLISRTGYTLALSDPIRHFCRPRSIKLSLAPLAALRQFRWKQFLLGFIGWLTVNTLAWLILLVIFRSFFQPIPSQEGLNQLNFLPFCCLPSLLNLVLVLGLFIKFRTAALGWVAAYGLNAIILLVLSAVLDKFGLVGIPALIFGAPAFLLGLLFV